MALLRYTRTRRAVFFVDHDSHFLIECYRFRGRIRCSLVHPVYYTYVEHLKIVNLQYVGVFEKCYWGGREGRGSTIENNIHVECQSCEEIDPSEYDNLDKFIDDLERTAEELQLKCTSYPEAEKQTANVEEAEKEKTPCFDYFGLKPSDEDAFLRSVECENECYFDRCDHRRRELPDFVIPK